jgi:cytochrome c
MVLAAAVALSGPAWAQGDPAKGANVFKRCQACHNVDKPQHRVGPSLQGVIGRKAGTAEGFKYSDAMLSSGITWDDASLDKYLENPKGVVAGTKMIFAGLKKPEERADVIAYLKQATATQ